MLIVLTLGVMFVLVFFSLILGNNFIDGVVTVAVDNEALVDGVSTTFATIPTDVLAQIDTIGLLGAILILSGFLIGIALLVGITVLATGLNPQSARIIILTSTYIGVWILLSTIAAPMIQSIEVFGITVYIAITLGYVVGVIQNITGSGTD